VLTFKQVTGYYTSRGLALEKGKRRRGDE